jgi:predicted dienelactone hydrolase
MGLDRAARHRLRARNAFAAVGYREAGERCRFSFVLLSRMLTLVSIFVLSLAACSSAPPVLVVTPSVARDGRDGSDGPFGAARLSMLTQVRVSERVELEVTFPADVDGTLRRDRAPYPTILFIAGGAVTPVRYRWITEHLATRGFVVIAPSYPLDLAIASPENTHQSLLAVRSVAARAGHPLERAVAPDGRVVVMGHSLGGVIATWQWLAHRYDGVALLASLPADGQGLRERAGSRVLSITGSEDGSALLPDVARGFQLFAPPRLLAVVDGMNHYDWTDGATAANLMRDRPSTRPQRETRRDALRVIDTFVDAVLLEDASAAARLDRGAFDGVTVMR